MGKLPSYRKHSSGQARVTLNGRVHYLGVYGTKESRQRYNTLLSEWLAADKSQSFGTKPDEIALSQLMADYLAYCRKYFGTAKNSELHSTKRILKIVADLYQNLPAKEFGPSQFKTVRQKLVDADCSGSRGRKRKAKPPKPKPSKAVSTTAKPQKLSRSYINSQMKRVCRLFKWGASEGLVADSIYNTLKLIPALKCGRTTARETEAVKPVDESLVLETIKHCSPVVADMIRVQLLTGMRPSEVCSLTPAMIDRRNEVWEAKLTKHKTANRGKSRTIYFGPESQAIIKPYLLRGENEPIFSPAESLAKLRALKSEERKTAANCGNKPGYSKRVREGRKAKRQPGTSYNSMSYRQAVRYAIAKGKLEHWHPNQLRHTAATKIRTMFGLDAAAAMLGHSGVAVTQVYAELDAAKAIDAARRVG